MKRRAESWFEISFRANNISVFDAESGEMIWRHSLSEEAIKSMRVAEFAAGEQGVIDRVIRYDRVRIANSVYNDVRCDEDIVVGDVAPAPNLNCPNTDPTLFMSQLWFMDGWRIWRTRINLSIPATVPVVKP